MKTILVTGVAGFIGFHLARRLCRDGWRVVGIDNLNSYYDVGLKRARLAQLKSEKNFTFHKLDLVKKQAVLRVFKNEGLECAVHLAAQAGVRYSLTRPQAYIDSNLTGFLNVLEGCRYYKMKHLIYASSSSVYGANTKMPFSVHDKVDHPMSLYAATKKANELIAHTYSSLFGIPVTGLRFFTVYGPWGRPDMAYFLFTKAILEKRAIDLFNGGRMRRDFTYIDDIVEALVRLTAHVPTPDSLWNGESPDSATSYAPYRLYNIGNSNPVDLGEFIEAIERSLGKVAKKNYLPLQPGDVLETYADVDDLFEEIAFKPQTPLSVGVANFVDWYKTFYVD